MLVIDQGAAIPASAFSNAKTALGSFVNDLQLTADQVGVESFTIATDVEQTLTHNGALAMTAINSIVQGGASYIGGGIAAAQVELTSPRHNPSAAQVIVILSDGADAGAPTSGATVTAASAAKAAGIQIISVQYGSSTSALMQSIASSASNFYLVSQ